MTPLLRPLLLASLLVASAASQAQSAPAPDLRAAGYLAGNCANCHGTAGRASSGTLPTLAGMSRDGLAKSLRDFRDGKRDATIMHQLAKGYSDEQIDLLAEFFSRQKSK